MVNVTETYDILIIYVDGEEHIVRTVSEYGMTSDNAILYYVKNNRRSFLNKDQVRFIGTISEYTNGGDINPYGYNKAIDEFIERLEKHEHDNWVDFQQYGITWDDINMIAKQMKGGNNENR